MFCIIGFDGSFFLQSAKSTMIELEIYWGNIVFPYSDFMKSTCKSSPYDIMIEINVLARKRWSSHRAR